MTPKQEAFCQAYIETGNASEAYRRAYPGSDKWKPEALWVKASQLLAKDKVRLRIAELQEVAAEKHEVTVESVAAKLELAYKAAAKFKQSGGMVQAQLGIAKLYGLIVDKQQDVTDRTSAAERLREIDQLLEQRAARGRASEAVESGGTGSRPEPAEPVSPVREAARVPRKGLH